MMEGERVHAQGGYTALVTWLKENRIAESSWFRWRKKYREEGVEGFMPKNNGEHNTNSKYPAKGGERR